MPIALNPPAAPAPDMTPATSQDSGAATGGTPVEGFAQLLREARGDRTGTLEKGGAIRLLPRDSRAPLASGKVDAPEAVASNAGNESQLDPAAMAAAMCAAIAAGVKTDAPVPQGVAAEALGSPNARGRSVASVGVEPADPDALPPISNAPSVKVPFQSQELLAAEQAAKDVSDTRSIRREKSIEGDFSVNAGAALAASPHASVAPPPATHVIDVPVTAPGWGGEFAGQLTHVVVMRNERAEFHLHPAELGPIGVEISFASDQAVVLITAAHAVTRDALEQALPYLRDMLADQGIALGQATVQEERNASDQERGQRAMASLPDSAAVDKPDTAPRTLRVRGLVDVFA